MLLSAHFRLRSEDVAWPRGNTRTRYNSRAAQLTWSRYPKMISATKSTAGRLEKGIACAQSAWLPFPNDRSSRPGPIHPHSRNRNATVCTWLTCFSGGQSLWTWKFLPQFTFTTIHVHHIPPEQLCRLMKATCFCRATSDWYRPCVKEVHPYNWDFF